MEFSTHTLLDIFSFGGKGISYVGISYHLFENDPMAQSFSRRLSLVSIMGFLSILIIRIKINTSDISRQGVNLVI